MLALLGREIAAIPGNIASIPGEFVVASPLKKGETTLVERASLQAGCTLSPTRLPAIAIIERSLCPSARSWQNEGTDALGRFIVALANLLMIRRFLPTYLIDVVASMPKDIL